MANTRFNISFVSAENTNYSPHRYSEDYSVEDTPDEVLMYEVQADTGGVTVELGLFATVDKVLIVNEDTTNYVVATWTNNATANSQRILAGEFLGFGGLTIANDLVLTANTAAVQCRVIVTGT